MDPLIVYTIIFIVVYVLCGLCLLFSIGDKQHMRLRKGFPLSHCHVHMYYKSIEG